MMGNVYFRQTCTGLRRENEKINNLEMTDNEILLSLTDKEREQRKTFLKYQKFKACKGNTFSNLVELSYETYEDLCIP